MALDSSTKYVSLVTRRRNGEGVQTPVWFAPVGEAFGVITDNNVGKVKRIRNNPSVTITPCDMRGNHLEGATTHAARARVVSGDEAKRVRQAIARKYPLAYRLLAAVWLVQVLVEKVKRIPQDPEVAILFTLE